MPVRCCMEQNACVSFFLRIAQLFYPATVHTSISHDSLPWVMYGTLSPVVLFPPSLKNFFHYIGHFSMQDTQCTILGSHLDTSGYSSMTRSIRVCLLLVNFTIKTSHIFECLGDNLDGLQHGNSIQGSTLLMQRYLLLVLLAVLGHAERSLESLSRCTIRSCKGTWQMASGYFKTSCISLC